MQKKKKKMVVVKCRSRPYYARRCKSKMTSGNNSLTNIESLPDELLVRILLDGLHAHEIYESALGVCRKWHHMIRTHDFIHAHLRHSTPGLLIQYFGQRKKDPNEGTFLTLRGGTIETFKFQYKTFTFWNTCNGLLLGIDHNYLPIGLSIANPATKQSMSLPYFPDHLQGLPMCSGIGYTPASMEYKVVRTFTIPGPNPSKHGCAILTVGVDHSWRYVDTQHISDAANSQYLGLFPLITEGFVYWTYKTALNITNLLSLDLETEIIREIQFPREYGNGFVRRAYYLSTSKSLTLLVGSLSGFSWDVWELETRRGEWKRLHSIDLEAQKCRVQEFLKPVGWLNYGQVLVLCPSSSTKVCLLYNVVTKETDYRELDQYTDQALFLSYKNSLVELDGFS